MSKIRIHYDGWITLPARARQALRLQAGDELEAEVKGGALVLQPIAKSSPKKVDAPAAPAPERAAAPASSAPARKRGRPRKVAAPTPPPAIKSRGRRKSPAASPSATTA